LLESMQRAQRNAQFNDRRLFSVYANVQKMQNDQQKDSGQQRPTLDKASRRPRKSGKAEKETKTAKHAHAIEEKPKSLERRQNHTSAVNHDCRIEGFRAS